MTAQEYKQIISNAVAIYGTETQINVSIEEMGELIVAINHYRRRRCSPADVIEEIADVAIMIEQLCVIFGREEVYTTIINKLTRLQERLDNHKS